jgi:hypothetical protein
VSVNRLDDGQSSWSLECNRLSSPLSAFVVGLAVHGDKAVVATTYDGHLVVWRLADGHCVLVHRCADAIYRMDYQAETGLCAIATRDSLELWRLDLSSSGWVEC